jgi:hypothetical protein
MRAVLLHLEDEDMFKFWYEPMESFGFDTLLYVDRSRNPYAFPATEELAYTRFGDLRSALNEYPRMEWVLFEPHHDIKQHPAVEGISLNDFTHPLDNFIYVFGADRTWDDMWAINPKNSKHVYIPGNSLRAVNAASMVLWDRRSKE